MGRVRKRASLRLIEEYLSRLAPDFHTTTRFKLDKVSYVPSRCLPNKTAGLSSASRPPLHQNHNMGCVRNKTTVRASRVLIEKYYPRLAPDFHTNKGVLDEIGDLLSTRLRNKIAGFPTHLRRRIEKGLEVRRISLKSQQEERERKDNYVPKVSALDTGDTGLEVDPDTEALLVHPTVAAPDCPGRRERRTVPGAGR